MLTWERPHILSLILALALTPLLVLCTILTLVSGHPEPLLAALCWTPLVPGTYLLEWWLDHADR